MRGLTLFAALLAALLLTIALASDPLTAWAVAQQRALQGDLAAALRAVRDGDPAAVAAVIGLCALYGVVHAVGPGHGKMLIGGAAVTSRATASRMAAIGLAASLAQGATAILLVFGGLGLFAVTSRSVIGLSDSWLTAASYLAFAAIGGWILWRGARLALRLWRARAETAAPAHHGGCGAGCRHAPTAQEVDRAHSWRDAALLVAGIGMRPCSGALIVLALAWRFETYAVGAAAVVAMALGTGLVVASVALAAVRLRDAGRLTETGAAGLWSFAAVQLGVGAAVMALSVSLAAEALDQRERAHPFGRVSSGAHGAPSSLR